MQWSRCLLSLELCAARPTYQHPQSQACCYDGSTERGLPPGPITGRIPKLSPLAASHILPPLTPLFLPCRYREPWLSATFFHAATYWMLENRETLLLRMGFCKVLDLSNALNGYLRSLARYAAHLTRRKEWCGTVPIRWRPSVGNQRYNHPRTTPPEHRLRGLGPIGSSPVLVLPTRPPSHGLRALPCAPAPRPPPRRRQGLAASSRHFPGSLVPTLSPTHAFGLPRFLCLSGGGSISPAALQPRLGRPSPVRASSPQPYIDLQ